MYPGWPLSSADLVPLPQCDGPKLKPFDFDGGKQRIEFLEHFGEGLHTHVFKVQIGWRIYALKLFRFVLDDDWLRPARDLPEDREMMSAFYNYAEPLSCECRAFGRLQEAGRERLAVECFGYVLLDEDHERELHSRFPDVQINGNIEYPGGPDDETRARFPGQDGRAPPIRGIVKEFAPPVKEGDLQRAVFRKYLGDVKRLQQLGILKIDVGTRQLVGGDGKTADFSTAITVPHFVTTPELNPRLTPRMWSAMEFETFRLCLDDYCEFDWMVEAWNRGYADEKGTIALRAFPGANGSPVLKKYNLRRKAADGERVLTCTTGKGRPRESASEYVCVPDLACGSRTVARMLRRLVG